MVSLICFQIGFVFSEGFCCVRFVVSAIFWYYFKLDLISAIGVKTEMYLIMGSGVNIDLGLWPVL